MNQPPSTCTREFILNLREDLNNFNKIGDIDIIVGDININILDENSELVSEYLNLLAEYRYQSTINTHTRIKGKSCIDHIFVNEKNSSNLYFPVVLQYSVTDHYPVMLLCPIESQEIVSYNKVKTKHYVDHKKLKECFEYENWLNVYEAENVDKAAELFVAKINSHIVNSTKQVRINRRNVKRTPWITDGLVKSVNTKSILYKKVCKDPLDSDALSEYKKYRNMLSNLIAITKSNYYKYIIEENKNDTKKLWRCVNGDELVNKADIAEQFNIHFNKIGENLVSNIKSANNYNQPNKRLPNSIYFSETSEEEVLNVIRSLKNKKAPGADGLRTEILKSYSVFLAKPLTYIINKAFIHHRSKLKEVAEKSFGKITRFLESRKLTINWTKTCYLPFIPYNRNGPQYSYLSVGRSKIESQRKTKYLGVVIDSHLRWSEQVTAIVKKLREKFRQSSETSAVGLLGLLQDGLRDSFHVIIKLLKIITTFPMATSETERQTLFQAE
nr:unnamed protein product [Callosobruchus chinensis]